MYDPGFWRKFRRLGWITLTLCLGVGYLVISAYTMGLGVVRLSPTSTVSGFLPPSDRGVIESVVCDVLGNVVPLARVEILDAKAITDQEGRFRIENVPTGLVDLRIKAKGFQDATIRILVEPGTNYPRINHDTGLWPTDFYIRFHIFTNSLEDADTRLLFGLVEIVNPGKEALLVSRIEVKDPKGQVVYDLLESEEILNHITQTYNLQLVLEPVPSYLVPPQGIVVFELDAIPDPPRGKFHLWLAYASVADHERGRFQAVHLADEMDYDPDLNPHTP
ncbi:MAG: carboxypeptidase regulatory-like domain-containing protein [Firmicutes bacterium]|nr:carboxypeptidase regulatory-like domain-containing protein [Bacillota bacterium]